MERLILRGVVHNGLIIPDKGMLLPDGATVEIALVGKAFADDRELAAEFALWDKAGAEAWAMIEQWEREEPVAFAQP